MKKRRCHPSEPKSVLVNVRLPKAMVDAIAKALERNPVEFRSAADFHRTALTNELRDRNLIE
jgi:Arc/MetJ-type ribon-helix-helix transcriptional regulator